VGRCIDKSRGELVVAMLDSEVDRTFFVRMSDKRFNDRSFEARFLLS
jgi:hypothetical protein